MLSRSVYKTCKHTNHLAWSGIAVPSDDESCPPIRSLEICRVHYGAMEERRGGSSASSSQVSSWRVPAPLPPRELETLSLLRSPASWGSKTESSYKLYSDDCEVDWLRYLATNRSRLGMLDFAEAQIRLRKIASLGSTWYHSVGTAPLA
jgi:hypothetical protein